MSSPPFDLSKVQFTSLANSFKNDAELYPGSITFSDPIPAGSTLTSSTPITVSSAPVFSTLYAYFQEAQDMTQQYAIGSGYRTAQWYQVSVSTQISVALTTAPYTNTILVGQMYTIINGNQVTVEAKIPNPYAVPVSYVPITIPWNFFIYSLTN